ncbi:unnamed protein product [Sphagnum jensenii]|uniref:Uncharacterized protein n=1 Tax=Sphagnum jensenii TaxID=128206 RepID=A0ABP1BC11_9BRYO
MLRGAVECEDDDDDSVAHMMLWETNRRAAALPPLGQVLATIFAAECREVEKNLASDSARTEQVRPGSFLYDVSPAPPSGTIAWSSSS